MFLGNKPNLCRLGSHFLFHGIKQVHKRNKISLTLCVKSSLLYLKKYYECAKPESNYIFSQHFMTRQKFARLPKNMTRMQKDPFSLEMRQREMGMKSFLKLHSYFIHICFFMRFFFIFFIPKIQVWSNLPSLQNPFLLGQ